MATCPSCAARAPAGAEWCGQCYARLGAPAPASTPAGEDVANRFGIVPATAAPPPPAPAGAPPATGVMDRFGIVHPAATSTEPPADGLAPAPAVPDQRMSWEAPRAGWAPPASPRLPVEPARTGSLGSWGWGSAGVTTIAMIALGGLIQVVFWVLVHKGQWETEKLVRFEIVVLVSFYLAVGLIVMQRVTVGGVRLLWTNGPPLKGIAIGAGVGLSLGMIAVGINSALAHRLAGDPSATLMVSEGDAAHIAAAVLIAVIFAPLIEETLFRGLFAESMRGKSLATAIWVSAAAFAAWHWQPASLKYYALMGAMLATLYFKRGLVCSIATHACFNGCLTVAAIIAVLSPGQVVTGDGFQLTAPRGWHNDSGIPGIVHLVGPSAADVAIFHEPLPPGAAVNPDDLIAEMEGGALGTALPGLSVESGSGHREHFPMGDAIRVDVVLEGHHGQFVAFVRETDMVMLGFGSGGSQQAEQDFDQMLESMRPA